MWCLCKAGNRTAKLYGMASLEIEKRIKSQDISKLFTNEQPSQIKEDEVESDSEEEYGVLLGEETKETQGKF